MKCDRDEALRISLVIPQSFAESSWISLYEGGVVILGPWLPVESGNK